MIIDELIFDRTQQNVNRAEELSAKGLTGMTAAEKAEWFSGMKGAYNALDLNRVERAVEYIEGHLNALPDIMAEYLSAIGVADDGFFHVPYESLVFPVKTNWDMDDIPVSQDMERYLSNVTAITAAIPIERALPETMDNLTWQGANEIERALSAEYSASLAWEAEKKQYADNTAAAWFYSGDLFCGEI